MIRSSTLLSRTVLTTLVAAPVGVMAILSIFVLGPTLKNPESKFYSSGIGYPALQRLSGKPIKVQTVPVTLKTLADSVAAPAESLALHKIDVRPLVSGPVEKVYVVEGQRVRQGQPLLQFQRIPFENAVSAARNNVAISEITLEGLQKSTAEQLVALKANAETAKDRLAVAKTRLNQINSLVDVDQKANIESARERLAIAEAKVNQISFLVKEGAVSQFQLYDVRDDYASRKKELLSAQEGGINNQSELYDNQSDYITSQNQLISAQQALARTQSDLDKQIKNARLKLENNKVALERALRDLNNTVLYASTDGLVSLVNIDGGEVAVARASRPIINISRDIVLKAYVDQARINAVKIGDQAIVRLVAYPGRTYQGRVIQLNPTVATTGGRAKGGIDRRYTYSVWIAVDSLQMPAGLQGYVQFSQGKKSLFIPESAVTHLSGGEGMVMVAEAGRAVVKRVKLGKIFDNQREVLEGLVPGEQVVPSPRALNPGDHLEIPSTKAEKPGDTIKANQEAPAQL